MPCAPDLSGSAARTYEGDPSNSLQGRFNIGAKYMSDYNTGSDLDVEKHPDAYTVVNARVGIGASDHRWSLERCGTNITDTEYVQVGFEGPLQILSALQGNPFNTFNAFPGAQRMSGVPPHVRIRTG